jgi:hypothetical protein
MSSRSRGGDATAMVPKQPLMMIICRRGPITADVLLCLAVLFGGLAFPTTLMKRSGAAVAEARRRPGAWRLSCRSGSSAGFCTWLLVPAATAAPVTAFDDVLPCLIVRFGGLAFLTMLMKPSGAPAAASEAH